MCGLRPGPASATSAQPPRRTTLRPPPASASKHGDVFLISQALDISDTGRRFTGGITVSVLGFISDPWRRPSRSITRQLSVHSTKPSVTPRESGTASRDKCGSLNHFSVDLSAMYRRAGYQFEETVATTTNTVLNGVVTSTTTTTVTHQDVHAHFFDFPLTVDTTAAPSTRMARAGSPRLGGAWRWANDIRTSTDTTDADGVNTCCTFTPVVPAHRSADRAGSGRWTSVHRSVRHPRGAGSSLHALDRPGI